MHLAPNILDSIGNTPMVRLQRLPDPHGAQVIVKLEAWNPGRSIKDRPALAMVLSAERSGRLKPGGTIVEATSGNMGVGLAIVGNARGYRVVVVMPELMSPQRVRLLRAVGAEVRLTPSLEGFAGALFAVEEMAEQHGYFMPQQWRNPANVQIHRETTGREIVEATDGEVDAFVAGVGTGGTITGVGEALKAVNPKVRVVAVEPAASAVLSGGRPGWTNIQGLGAGFVPEILNRSLLDEVLTVTDREAEQMSAALASEEGILAGISSGANVAIALKVAAAMRPGQRVVTILPDTGERYVGSL
jgi:cysteine synthase